MFVFLFLSYFTLYDSLRVHPCPQDLISPIWFSGEKLIVNVSIPFLMALSLSLVFQLHFRTMQSQSLTCLAPEWSLTGDGARALRSSTEK